MTLKPFDDRDVVACSVRIVRAGDGLSEGLDVDPVEFALDDFVHVVLRCQVSRVAYEEIKDTGDLRRVHTLTCTSGTVVDQGDVRKVLDAQRKRIETAKGLSRLPGTDEP